MSEIIDYSNPELERKIKELYGESYGPLQPIIVDLLLKRNYVFNLTETQSIEEAKRILENVMEFHFVDKTKNYEGLYTGKERKIDIVNDIVKRHGIKGLYNVMVHEVFHALSAHFEYADSNTGNVIVENYTQENILGTQKNKKFINGLYAYEDGRTSYISYGTGMDEAFNEVATGMFYNHERGLYTSKDMGYPQLTFLPHMLAAAIGTTDCELVYASRVSPEVFRELIFKQFGVDERKLLDHVEYDTLTEEELQERREMRNSAIGIDRLISSIDCEMENLHSVVTSTETLGKEEQALKKSSYESIVYDSFYLANMQIKKDSRPISKELIDELLIRYSKMDVGSRIALQKLGLSNIKMDAEIKMVKEDMLNRIFGVYVINILQSKISDKEVLEKYTEIAKSGKIFDFMDNLNEIYNIDINQIKKNEFMEYIESRQYEKSEYFQKLEQEDLFGRKVWDESRETQMINEFMQDPNITKKEIKLLSPIEMIGLGMENSENHYTNMKSRARIIELSKKTGIPEEKLIEELNEMQKKFNIINEKLSSEKKFYVSKDGVSVIGDYEIANAMKYIYVHSIKLIESEMENNKQLSVVEIVRAGEGLKKLKEYNAQVLEQLQEDGRIYSFDGFRVQMEVAGLEESISNKISEVQQEVQPNIQETIQNETTDSFGMRIAKFIKGNNFLMNIPFVNKFVDKRLNLLTEPTQVEVRTTQTDRERFLNEISNNGQYREEQYAKPIIKKQRETDVEKVTQTRYSNSDDRESR